MVARNTLGTSDGKEVFPQMNVKSATAIDLIKLPISLHACAPISELPYNISTMALSSGFHQRETQTDIQTWPGSICTWCPTEYSDKRLDYQSCIKLNIPCPLVGFLLKKSAKHRWI